MKNAFKDVNSIVITQSMAKKYFGDEDAMGKVLHEDGLGDLMVTGVVKDVPSNSHFHFDFLISTRKFAGDIDGNWGFYNFYTYIKLKPDVNIKAIEPKIQAIYKRNNDNDKNIFYTQPLTGIHLDSDLKWELEPCRTSAVLIAVITISLQAIKAALANPVKSLRTE
jgi:putative ABC transport system permease protein